MQEIGIRQKKMRLGRIYERRLEMPTGDVPCSCCGGYHGCNCGRRQTTYGGGWEDKRIADALERLIELLEKLTDEEGD